MLAKRFAEDKVFEALLDWSSFRFFEWAASSLSLSLSTKSMTDSRFFGAALPFVCFVGTGTAAARLDAAAEAEEEEAAPLALPAAVGLLPKKLRMSILTL